MYVQFAPFIRSFAQTSVDVSISPRSIFRNGVFSRISVRMFQWLANVDNPRALERIVEGVLRTVTWHDIAIIDRFRYRTIILINYVHLIKLQYSRTDKDSSGSHPL